MNNRYVILVRHGASQEDGKLSQNGEAQCISFAKNLLTTIINIKTGNNVLLSSTAPRAWGSAMVLQQELNLPDPILIEDLWADKHHPYSPQKIESLKERILIFLNANVVEGSVLFIVTHLEFTNDFLSDAGFSGRLFDCNYGEGVMLSKENYTISCSKVIETSYKDRNLVLQLLHSLLGADPKHLPDLPSDLSKHKDSYDMFSKSVESCDSSIDDNYSKALSILRDKLLN